MRSPVLVVAIGFSLLLAIAAVLWTIHSEWQSRRDALATAQRALKECDPGKADGDQYDAAVFKCEVRLAAGARCC
jgi:hypothetical protein